MSRYAGYPRWILLVRPGIYAIAMPVIIYLWLCDMAIFHYKEELGRYDDPAMEISSGWSKGRDFDEYHRCIVARRLAAGDEAADHAQLGLWQMLRDWNRDFLAEQPVCPQEGR